MSISSARRAAFRLLKTILAERGYASELLHAQPIRYLKDSDKRLTTELVYGVLRQCRLLDWILSDYVQKGLHKLDTEVLMALRLGAYQLLFLTKIPVRAVVHESVELVKTMKLASAAGFVNAVLRKIDKEQVQVRIDRLPLDSAEGLSIRFSHPEWLIQRWIDQFGLDRLTQLLIHNNTSPTTFFRINSPYLTQSMLREELEDAGVKIRVHPLSHDILEVLEGDLQKTRALRDHAIHIQDSGSQLIPSLLDLKSGEYCLDLCAGLGGKATQMAQIQDGGTCVVASDVHWRRLSIGRQLHAKHWPTIQWVTADATRPLPFKILFDKILLDVPCSGTGTLQRRPEIRWRLREAQLAEFHKLQVSLLSNAVNYLRPGGLLLYSTCSLLPEENEQVLRRFIETHPQYTIAPPPDSVLKDFFDPNHFLVLFPPETCTDGFFAALIRQKGA